ncbi:MAG: hypothetical protein JF613_05175, partial [Acidobacteria bacterium]|nr:hypothetical protein [Acidobacteriota bacterium]
IVTLGAPVAQQVEITSGLVKGETIAAAPKGHVADGMDVRTRALTH